MNLTIPRDLSIPIFLDRKRTKFPPWSSGPSIIPALPIDDFRSRHPLGERDKAAIAALEAGENRLDNSSSTQVSIPSATPGPIRSRANDKQLTGMVVHRRPGIIACIMSMMSRKEGASWAEMLVELERRFPDRESKGMLSTIKIQSKKLCTKKRDDKKRGAVYYMIVED